jgi:hypothetical protein
MEQMTRGGGDSGTEQWRCAWAFSPWCLHGIFHRLRVQQKNARMPAAKELESRIHGKTTANGMGARHAALSPVRQRCWLHVPGRRERPRMQRPRHEKQICLDKSLRLYGRQRQVA